MKQNKLLILFFLIAFSFTISGCVKIEDADKKENTQNTKEENVEQKSSQPEVKTGDLTQNKKIVTLSTSKGDIELELYVKAAPKTVDNFLDKIEKNFYNNLTFHRVEDWVIQGGDPDGNGTGGGDMKTELNDLTFSTGSLGVARGGDINFSNDSQFFIVKSDADWLDKQYTNFGKVTTGMDVVNKMEIGDKILGIQIK